MVYTCKVENNLGIHTYLRGDIDDVYDIVDQYFITNETREPMIVNHIDREDNEVFVHLLVNNIIYVCEPCNICLNSEKQYYHHIRGRRHLCSTG